MLVALLLVATQIPAMEQWPSRFSTSFGIHLEYIQRLKTDPDITYDLPSASDANAINAYTSRIFQELKTHSAADLKFLNIKKLGIYKDLKLSGQLRAAIPLAESNTLLLSFEVGANHPDWQIHAFEHELFHVFAYRISGDYYWHDRRWESCNPAGFSYGTGGVNQRDPRSAVLNHPTPGFVDGYAESAEEEDMAEIEACMRLPKETALLDTWRKTDPYLDAKVHRMTEILAREK